MRNKRAIGVKHEQKDFRDGAYVNLISHNFLN